MGREHEKDNRRHYRSRIPGRHRSDPHAGPSACIVPAPPGTREAGPEFQVGEPVREEGRQEGEEGQEGQEEDVIRVAAVRPPGESCDSIEGKRATRNPELAVESWATPRGVLTD